MTRLTSRRKGPASRGETQSTTRSTSWEICCPSQPRPGQWQVWRKILTETEISFFSNSRQRLSQLQLMALILVYVRKTNYFEKRECFYPELNGQPHCSQLNSKLDQRRQNRIKLFSNDSKARSPGFTGVLEQFPVWVEWLQLRTRISIDETPPGLAWCLWCPAIILINGF